MGGPWSCVSVPSCRHVSRSPWLPSGSRARRAVLVGSRPGSGLSYLGWTSAPGPSGPELRRETQGAWPGSARVQGRGPQPGTSLAGPRQSLMCEGFLCVCSQRRKTVATRSSRSPASSPAPTPSSGHRRWPLPGVLHLAQLWVSVCHREVLPKPAVPLVPYCPHLLSAPKTDLNCFPSRRWALKRKQPNH